MESGTFDGFRSRELGTRGRLCWRESGTLYAFRSEVKEYGTVPAGIHQKSPEHGSSIPAGKFPDFFRCIRITFVCFLPGTGRKSAERIRKFSGRNTASMLRWLPVYSCSIQRFLRLFPASSFGIWSLESSTWDLEDGTQCEFGVLRKGTQIEFRVPGYGTGKWHP